MNGHIYYLVNRAMVGLIKIGYTNISLYERLSQLNTTGVPIPFELGASFLVSNAKQCENEIHKELKKYRIANDREFFNISLMLAVSKTINIIQKWQDGICDQPASNNITNKSNIELSENETKILLLLTDSRKFGLLTWQIHEMFLGFDKLDIEYFLACLKEHSLVEEKYDRQHKERNWRISSTGIKYLYDSKTLKTKS